MNYFLPTTLAIAVMVAAALSFSGCGDQASSEKSSPASSPDSRTATSTPLPADPHAKGAERTATAEAGSPTSPTADRNSVTTDTGRASSATESERTAGQANRVGEEIKGVAGQTEDPAQAARNREEAAKHAPDDTGRNIQDRNATAVTPMDQSEDQADINITAEIRRIIVRNDGFSSLAKNIKIITRDGRVTLRGPVSTASEKDAIRDIALSVRGVQSVDNALEVVQ